MTKSLIPTENSKSKVTSQKRHQNVDNTTIADPTKDGQLEYGTQTDWCG